MVFFVRFSIFFGVLCFLNFVVSYAQGYETGRIWYERPKNATGNITFGIPVTLSGDSAVYLKMGAIIFNTMDMWAWWINEQYGGIKIGNNVYFAEVKYIDDKGIADRVTNVTKYLIDKEDAQFIFAPYSTTLTKPAAVVCEEKKVLIMGSSASSSSIYADKKYLYSTLSSSGNIMKAAIKTLVLRGARKIVKINQGRTFTRSMCSTLSDYLDELATSTKADLSIVYETELSYTPDEAEVDALIWNLTNLIDDHVDISVGCVYYDVCAMMIEKAKMYKYEPDAMIFSICVDNSNYITDVGTDDGRYMLGAVQWHEDMPLSDDITGFSAKDYSNIYRSRYNNATPPYQSPSYFASGVALVKAIENAGSLDSDEVAYALSRLDIDTFFGTINFDSLNQNSADMSYIQYDEEGSLKIVIPDSVATGSLIHPMPSWSYRDCVIEYGENSCKCSDEGCPTCTLVDYNYTVTDCSAAAESRWVVYNLMTDCENGTSLPDPIGLECDHVPLGSTTAAIVQALAYISFAVGFCFLVWTVIFRKANVVKASQPTFCYLIAIGGMVCAISPVTNLGQNTDSQCQARPWVFHIPFTLMIGSLFVKTFRVWRIFGNAKLTKVKVTLNDSLKLLGIIMSVPLMVLLVWFIVYPPIAVDDTISITNVGNIPTITCRSFDTFTTVLVVYEVGLILISCYFSFKNRKVGNAFSETRYLVFAVYSIALILFITSLVAAMDVPISVEILMHGVGASLSCAISLCTIFIPKIIMHINVPEKEVFNTANNGTGTSNGKDAPAKKNVGNRNMIHVCERKEEAEESFTTINANETIEQLLGIIQSLNNKIAPEERVDVQNYALLNKLPLEQRVDVQNCAPRSSYSKNEHV